MLRRIDLSYDVAWAFDAEALYAFSHISSTRIFSEWLICHVMSQACSMMKDCINTIAFVQRNYGKNDWFLIWCVMNDRNWRIAHIRSDYFNRALFSAIDLSYDLTRMFDDEALATFVQISSTELCLEWSISHIICQECSTVKDCLHSITLVQRYFD